MMDDQADDRSYLMEIDSFKSPQFDAVGKTKLLPEFMSDNDVYLFTVNIDALQTTDIDLCPPTISLDDTIDLFCYESTRDDDDDGSGGDENDMLQFDDVSMPYTEHDNIVIVFPIHKMVGVQPPALEIGRRGYDLKEMHKENRIDRYARGIWKTCKPFMKQIITLYRRRSDGSLIFGCLCGKWLVGTKENMKSVMVCDACGICRHLPSVCAYARLCCGCM